MRNEPNAIQLGLYVVVRCTSCGQELPQATLANDNPKEPSLWSGGKIEVFVAEHFCLAASTEALRSELAKREAFESRNTAAIQKAQIAHDEAEYSADAVARLRAWRYETARETMLPTYVIMPNAVLYDMATVNPKTLEEMAGVRGMGPARIERYGEAILAALDSTEPVPQC